MTSTSDTFKILDGGCLSDFNIDSRTIECDTLLGSQFELISRTCNYVFSDPLTSLNSGNALSSDNTNIITFSNFTYKIQSNKIYSPNSRYVAKMDSTGDFIIYETITRKIIWHTNTKCGKSIMVLQPSDGNLVLYDVTDKSNVKALWSSGTYQPGDSTSNANILSLDNGGNLIIWSPDLLALNSYNFDSNPVNKNYTYVNNKDCKRNWDLYNSVGNKVVTNVSTVTNTYDSDYWCPVDLPKFNNKSYTILWVCIPAKNIIVTKPSLLTKYKDANANVPIEGDPDSTAPPDVTPSSTTTTTLVPVSTKSGTTTPAPTTTTPAPTPPPETITKAVSSNDVYKNYYSYLKLRDDSSKKVCTSLIEKYSLTSLQTQQYRQQLWDQIEYKNIIQEIPIFTMFNNYISPITNLSMANDTYYNITINDYNKSTKKFGSYREKAKFIINDYLTQLNIISFFPNLTKVEDVELYDLLLVPKLGIIQSLDLTTGSTYLKSNPDIVTKLSTTMYPIYPINLFALSDNNITKLYKFEYDLKSILPLYSKKNPSSTALFWHIIRYFSKCVYSADTDLTKLFNIYRLDSNVMGDSALESYLSDSNKNLLYGTGTQYYIDPTDITGSYVQLYTLDLNTKINEFLYLYYKQTNANIGLIGSPFHTLCTAHKDICAPSIIDYITTNKDSADPYYNSVCINPILKFESSINNEASLRAACKKIEGLSCGIPSNRFNSYCKNLCLDPKLDSTILEYCNSAKTKYCDYYTSDPECDSKTATVVFKPEIPVTGGDSGNTNTSLKPDETTSSSPTTYSDEETTYPTTTYSDESEGDNNEETTAPPKTPKDDKMSTTLIAIISLFSLIILIMLALVGKIFYTSHKHKKKI